MLKGTTKILTPMGEIPLWKLKKGMPIIVEGKPFTEYSVKRTHREQMFLYTITTYAGEFEITCSPNTLIVTDKGDIEIDKLKKDIGVYIRGVMRPTRLSAVKRIKKGREEECTGVIVNKDVLVNSILVNGKQLYNQDTHAIS